MNDKFSLKWNDYHSNWTQSLSELRNDQDSADVTLISDDKVKFTAHKIILSSCSKMFKFILKGNFQANPLLFLSGVSSVNLRFILDYIYYGEVNLFQEQLDNFLESAQKLEIEGLIGDNSEQENQDLLGEKDKKYAFQEQNIEHINDNNTDRGLAKVHENAPLKRRKYNKDGTSNNHVAKIDTVQMTAEEIDMKKNELCTNIDGVWGCMACTYTTAYRKDVKKHVETNLAGLCYNCTLCNKEFRSNNSLTNHNSRLHK